MPKKDGDNVMISETGNWNVADKFSKYKIMKPLILCDRYEDIAYFGYQSIQEELINYSLPSNDIIKIKAMQRLVRELIRLIDNSKFAMKVGKTKQTVLQYKDQLQKIEIVLPKLIKRVSDQIHGTSTIVIKDYVVFEKILSQISKIKSKINEPLNKNHLIFTDKEEFDPRAFKNDLKERMVNKG